MFRTMMKSKIHRARITDANLNYVGSVTIDQDILDKVDILPNEKVQIVNNNNGARLETYVIPGERGTGIICLNGAAARLVQKDDIVIIITYASFSEDELRAHRPKIAIMNERNEIEQFIEEEPPLTVL
ncbi:aspartate 1-decarboxylase [Pseudogracilibacillus auburnensis]|uniref:Aspartate 1-decarboxylase n=1 Tax=Pseudogracilibacillus auburnensis TaxID=1494959 RepID=A0A2V3WJ14_9BACI|nr:aspartate 1-decarboxylase [Pseudogracilibacillus auburnensis]MBO1003026.1 aspartate 1-decarboxylase [Pseudogracilibacillus auburnensis]PXW88769.1 L-aspartate 1-decarboxylase [Pseudogracilibacillus auburnensis]